MLAQFPFLGQRSEDDVVHAGIEAGLDRRGREAAERKLPGEQLVKHHPQRINVGPVVHLVGRLHLFRGHVMRCADPGPGAGERVRFARRGTRTLKQLRDAEIGNFHAALGIQQQVLRLDIPMQHPLRMRGLQRLTNRRNQRQRLLRREAPGSQRLAEVGPVHELHEQEAEPTRLPKPMDAHDVRMPQPRERTGLALESFHEGRIGGQFTGQHLERRDSA